MIPVPYEDLPVYLPKDVSFTGEGNSITYIPPEVKEIACKECLKVYEVLNLKKLLISSR